MVFFPPRPEGSGSKWWLMVVMSVSARELVTESIQDLIRVSDEPHGIITETLHARSVKTRQCDAPPICCLHTSPAAHLHTFTWIFIHQEKKNSMFYICQIYTIGPVINNLFQLSLCEVKKVLPRSPTHKTLIFLRESGAARSDHSSSRQPDTDPIFKTGLTTIGSPVTNQPVGLSEHVVLQNLSSLLLLVLQLVWRMTHHIQDQQVFTKMNEVDGVKD